ncbi:MAG TPA: cytochrome c biogenesis protein ResB [Anaerolineae bacterium]|nr:cytochrome c biogenesis protein ResB [Anaerolineae bacterium]
MAERVLAERSSRPDPLNVVWHVLAAPETLLAFLGLLVVTLVATGFVPQLPLAARSNPLQWLATQPNVAGSAWIRALHLYAIAHTLWLRLLLGFLAALLLVRLARSADVACHASARRLWSLPRLHAWSRRAREEWDLGVPAVEAIGAVRQRLGNRGLRWFPAAATAGAAHVASRRRWALWAAPFVYAGLLAALAGVQLVLAWGWQSEPWQPNPGESRAVGAEGVTTVRMESFALRRGDSGKVTSATTEISWTGENELGRSTLATGRPARLRRLAVRQLGYVPLLSIRGWDEEGRPLLLQEETGSGLPTDLRVEFPSPEARPVLFLGERDQLLVLSFEPGGRSGQPVLELTRTAGAGAQQTPAGMLYESGTVNLDGMRLQVEMTFRPILQADYLPGVGLVIGGCALALIALAFLWLVRPALLWVSAIPGAAGTSVVRLFEVAGYGEGRMTTSDPTMPSAQAARLLSGAGRMAFLVLGAAATAAAGWAWRATGSLANHSVEPGWLLAGVLLAAMGLVVRQVARQSLAPAAGLALLSAAALVAGIAA